MRVCVRVCVFVNAGDDVRADDALLIVSRLYNLPTLPYVRACVCVSLCRIRGSSAS